MRTFSDYLNMSVTDPNILRSPYTREHRRIVSYMSWLKKQLARRARDPAGSVLVSVVIPTFNRADILRRAVLSVLTQSLPRLELLVVDDGSTDETTSVVRSFNDERIRLIRCGSNRGHAHARNVGIEAARGDYIAFLDSDDWWDQHFLRIMLDQIQSSGHRFAYSAQRVIRPGGRSRQTRRAELIRFAPYNASLLENNNYISQIAVLHERSLALEVGGYNEAYRKFADWEFFLRLASLSPPLAIPVVLSHYNQSAQATVSSSVNRVEFLERLRGDLASRPIDPADLLRVPGGCPERDHDSGASGQGARILTVDADHDGPDTPRDPATVVVPSYPELFALRQPSSAVAQRRCAIVIPSFGVPDYLRLCLGSILRFTEQGTYRVIVVDNASPQTVQRILDEFEPLPQVQVLRNTTNLGFTRAAQQGIELAASDEDVVVMNNDAVVTPGWLNELSETAHRYEDAGIVAPRQVLFPGDKGLKIHVPGAAKDFEVDTNLSHHHRNVIDPFFDTLNNVIELDFVPFFCVLIRREVIETVGPLSPEMGVHYQSDWVYSDTTRHIAQRRILHTARSKVYHFSGRATRELRDNDLATFEAMGVREDWRAVVRGRSRALSSGVVA